MSPDILVLQECSPPLSIDDQCIWFETIATKGVGVIANQPWTAKQAANGVPQGAFSIYPIEVYGPESFHLLAVWAQRKPTYVGSILADLDRYQQFIEAKPTVIIGDFNSAAQLRNTKARLEHQILENRLTDFGLINATEHYSDRTGATPLPTHYLYRKEERPYHLDYCFVPSSWASRIRTVEIGTYDAWKGESDHCPILVELKEESS